jgi:quinol-cytochrome oxidoreductase complex cytochrome b subunit
MPGMKELTNLYVSTKARLEEERGPPKKQKAVEGITLGDELIRDGALIAFMVGTLFLLIAVVPPPLHEAYDMVNPPTFVKPDWYLLWSLGPIFLAKWPIMNPLPIGPDVLIDTKFLGTILVNVAFVALMVIPFIGKGKARRPIESPLNASMGVLGLAAIYWLSVVGIADILFAYEVQPHHGGFHWLFQSGLVPDPAILIDILGVLSFHQTALATLLTYWLIARHRPKYESKLNATYFKVR